MSYQKYNQFPLLVEPVINFFSNCLDYKLNKHNKLTVAYSFKIKCE